jgi:hypothetical protein
MDLTYSQIAQASMFSNDKMVTLIKQRLAESANAAVALVFDDKLIVLDEEKDEFYSVNYKVENKALKLEGWDKVNLLADNESRLETLSEEFFDPYGKKEITVKSLVEAFKLKHSDQPVRMMLNRTATEKKRIVESNDRIKAIREVRDAKEYFSDDIAEIFNDPKIKALSSKMAESNPVQASVNRINFSSPISISLLEESSNKIINLSEKKKSKVKFGNIKKKVQNMWTSESFKKDLKSLINEMGKTENVKLVLESFIKQHVEILILEASEIEDLVLKTALMINEAAKADSLVGLFREYCSLDEAKKQKEDFISRNNIVSDSVNEQEEPEVEKETDKEEPKEKETSIDEDSINKILKVLNKIGENLKEKTMESRYVKSFVTALEDAKVGSVSEGKLKEVLDFLSTVYDSAQEEKDEGEEA